MPERNDRFPSVDAPFVNLNTEIADGASELRVPEQQPYRPQIPSLLDALSISEQVEL